MANDGLGGGLKQGVYGVTDLFIDQRKYDKDKSKFFIWRERGFAAMASLLITRTKKLSVTDPQPKHFEDGYRPMDISPTGASTSTTTGGVSTMTFTVAAGDIANFLVDQTWMTDIFQKASGTPTLSATRSALYTTPEQILITDVNTSTNTVTARRALGVGTFLGSAVELSTSSHLYLMTPAITEGDGNPASFNQNAVVANNNIQILMEPYEMTDVAQKTEIFGENEWQRKARNARKNFTRQLARMFVNGHMDTIPDANSGNQLKYISGGLNEWIPADSTHQIDLGNKPPTQSSLNNALLDVFLTGSPEKWGISGGTAMNQIANAGADNIRYNEPVSIQMGMEVNSFRTGLGGILHFIFEFEMSKIGMSREMMIADLDYLQYMYLDGTDIMIDKGKNGNGLQANNEKKTIHQIYGIVGMKRTFADTHFKLYGFPS
jgi:hypothetical protein